MALDIKQLQSILDNASKSEAKTTDLKRAMKKLEAGLSNVLQLVADVNEILSDEFESTTKTRKPRTPKAAAEAVEVDPAFPYGKKKDGSAKARPGRSKEAAE